MADLIEQLPDGPVAMSWPLGALDRVSRHDPMLMKLAYKFRDEEWTLGDVRAVLFAGIEAEGSPDPTAETTRLIEGVGALAAAKLAMAGLLVGLGFDREETPGKKPRRARSSKASRSNGSSKPAAH